MRQLGVVMVQRRLAGRPRVGRVEVADVDVRREVQLLAPQLPHRHHHEPDGRAVVGLRLADLAAQLGVAHVDRDVQADVGEARQLTRDLLGRPPPQLARPEAQNLVPPDAAQARLHAGEIDRSGGRGPDLARDDVGRLRAAQPRIRGQPREGPDVRHQEAGKEVAAREDRVEQRPIGCARRHSPARLDEPLAATVDVAHRRGPLSLTLSPLRGARGSESGHSQRSAWARENLLFWSWMTWKVPRASAGSIPCRRDCWKRS